MAVDGAYFVKDDIIAVERILNTKEDGMCTCEYATTYELGHSGTWVSLRILKVPPHPIERNSWMKTAL